MEENSFQVALRSALSELKDGSMPKAAAYS